MENNCLKLSVRMALLMGLLLPALETVRRIHQILEFKEFFSWFDDYTFGALIISAAYAAMKQKRNSVSYLIAAWGIGVGGAALSFLGEFEYFDSAAGDPGIFPTPWWPQPRE